MSKAAGPSQARKARRAQGNFDSPGEYVAKLPVCYGGHIRPPDRASNRICPYCFTRHARGKMHRLTPYLAFAIKMSATAAFSNPGVDIKKALEAVTWVSAASMVIGQTMGAGMGKDAKKAYEAFCVITYNEKEYARISDRIAGTEPILPSGLLGLVSQ